MDMDFDRIVRALKRIGYQGYFTLEADQYLSAYTQDNVFEGVQALCRAAKLLCDLFEQA